MPRVKKSRKGGPIGVSKPAKHGPSKTNRTAPVERTKKRKGLSPGSRNNVEQKTKVSEQANQPKDKRLGSKKPIALVVTEKPKATIQTPKRKYATPAQELAALEADARFNALLDQLDDGAKLSDADQKWLDNALARHQVLCDLLGIKPEETEQDDDPFASLEAIRLDDFNDE